MSNSKKKKQPITGGIARVPFIMQMEALECGAASLAMVLAYYDKWVPLEQVRIDCGVSRDGSNGRSILLAARNYGLDAAGFKVEPEQLREEGMFPCIAHFDFNHFVVVNGFKGDKVYLNDPAKGTYSISMEEFDRHFTGVCIMFEPTDDFVADGHKRSTFDFARKRLKGCGYAICFVIITTVITSLIGIIDPVFSRIFMDRLLTGKNPDWYIPFIIFLAIFGFVRILASFIQVTYSRRINGRMAVYGNSSYMWKVLNLPMDFFSQRYAQDILDRRSGNADVAYSLIYTYAPLFINVIMMGFYLVVMIRYSIILTCVGISSIVLDMVSAYFISKKRINLARIRLRDQGKLSSSTTAGIEMIETIKASGAEEGYFRKWAGYQAGVNSLNVRFTVMDEILVDIPLIISGITDAVVLVLGVYLTMKGHFTIGMITAFQGFLTSFSQPAQDFITAGRQLTDLRTQMERIEDVMEYPEDDNGPMGKKNQETDYSKLMGKVELKNVTFGYSRLSEPLIRDFSLKVEKGSRVAFVGESGCGKSTLSKLISGLYKPWEGGIYFDGIPIGEVDKNVFSGSLAVVDQDIILFEDTISANIKMWDKSIEDFEVIMAARDAQIHNDIMRRDKGYDHKMIEGGNDFSGGQRQRMEIARVLAQDPTIIILDEATSALDAQTEYEAVNAIKDRGITCIVIAHRLSTIRDCDEIVVLKHGEVVGRGRHDDLYRDNEYYRELVLSE